MPAGLLRAFHVQTPLVNLPKKKKKKKAKFLMKLYP